jgi:hypothetical protein
MAHPERVAGAVVAASGWYTFPDAGTRYPYGIAPSGELPVRFEPAKFLRVPMTVVVGLDDTTNADLRRNERVDARQGVTRVERARSWVESMRAAAETHHVEPRVSLQEVPGIGHSFGEFVREGRLAERIFEALFSGAEASAEPVR